MAKYRVLSVGQCGFDNGTLKRFLGDGCSAEMEAVDTGAQVEKRLASEKYDLVLVNRVLDLDGSSGVELIKRLASDGGKPPMMLVSNYEEAQEQAVAAGAVYGFGKSNLHETKTVQRVREALEGSEG